MNRPAFRFTLFLVLPVLFGCSGQHSPTSSPLEQGTPDGIGLHIVDVNWLRNGTFFMVGNEKLTWRFEDTSVEVSHDGQPLPDEIVKEILKGPSIKARKITASWELVEKDRKLRLFNMKVDGADASQETKLPFEGAGEAHLNLGTHQYRIRSTPVSGSLPGSIEPKLGPRETFVKYFQAMDARDTDAANALKAPECTDTLHMNIHNLDIVDRLQAFCELSTSNQALVVAHPFTISRKVLDREEVIYAQLAKQNGAWRIQKLARTSPENASVLMKGFQIHSDVKLNLSTEALIGRWWYPCDSTIVLNADGTGSNLEVGPAGPDSDEPVPFKWAVNGATLILRFEDYEERLLVTSIDHIDVSFGTKKVRPWDGWRRRVPDLDAFEAKLEADPQYLMRLLAEDRDTAEALIRAGQKQRPTARLWAVDVQGLFAGDVFTGKSLQGKEKVAHFKHALAYLRESCDIAVQTLNKSHDEELQAALPGLRLDLALAAVEAGEVETAKKHAADTLHNNTDRTDWNYGNIIHNANQILGRCALREGKLADAKKYLLEAGATPGSPQLDSSGPQMQLARELLKKGEKEVVLQYLDLVASFWANPDERTEANTKRIAREHLNQLETWKRQIRAGKLPDHTKWK